MEVAMWKVVVGNVHQTDPSRTLLSLTDVGSRFAIGDQSGLSLDWSDVTARSWSDVLWAAARKRNPVMAIFNEHTREIAVAIQGQRAKITRLTEDETTA